jgi:hypothetical protein
LTRGKPLIFFMENITEVLTWFLPLKSGTPMKQMKTQVLNLKKLKTHVPIGYLTLFCIP